MSSWDTQTGGENHALQLEEQNGTRDWTREGKARGTGSQQRNHRRENPASDKAADMAGFYQRTEKKSILLYSDLCTTVAQMAGTLEDALMTYRAKDLNILRAGGEGKRESVSVV